MQANESIRIGTAGWGIPAAVAAAFPGPGSQLERYARVFTCTEINSTFQRVHRAGTYARWAASVPEHFRFAVKLRRTITHERRLVDCNALVRDFLDETAALGPRRGALLVQLPPTLAYDERTAGRFFTQLRDGYAGAVALEPRHASWFTTEAEARLRAFAVSRAAADPAPVRNAALPGGDVSVRYFRWHGSPRMYWSSYDAARLDALSREVESHPGPAWCIFDNTARGAAAENALALLRAVHPVDPAVGAY